MSGEAPQYMATLTAGVSRLAASLRAERMRYRDFCAEAWPIVNPGIPYIPNWHQDLIAEHLEAVHLGQIKLLDIEMPPRYGKSYHVTVAFPCWEWTEDPSERFLFSSYNQKLCTRHNLDRRAIIRSNWYRNRWGEFVVLADDQDMKTEFQNTARGHMITAPFGGSGTGSGGRRLIVDDPINPKQAASKVQREAAVDFYKNSLTTRLDDEANSAVIIVAQRTDKDDVQGRVVSEKDGWTILRIPIEAKRKTTYTYPLSGATHVYETGEVLCPARKSKQGVAALRRAMGRSASAQLDQEPAADMGLLIPREAWRELRAIPASLFSVHSWDTAVKDAEQNDPSAGVFVVKHAKGYHVCRGVTNEHLRFSALKVAVKNRYSIDRPDAVLVEDKSSGQSLIQELQDDPDSALPVLRFGKCKHGREGCECIDAIWAAWMKLDKHARASLVQPLWQAGLVSYDPDMENAAEMIEQFAKFPKGDHDDMVDAVVHAVRYLSLIDRTEQPQESQESQDAAMDDGL